MKVIDKIVQLLLIIGAIVWGIIAICNINIVEVLFGNIKILTRIIYGLVGLSGIYGIKFLFN